MLAYVYFQENYNLIPIELSKNQTLHVDPKETHQINFTAKHAGNKTAFLIIEEVKETILDFQKGNVKLL